MLVIPGRAKGANPESSDAFPFHVEIPGSLTLFAPGMTNTGSLP